MDKELQKLIDSVGYENCVHFICPKWNKKDETMNNIVDEIIRQQNEIIRQQTEHKERALAEIITKYDFIVGSVECKYRLMEILPEGASITCSPYIEDPTMIYAIKKFDIRDLLK